MNEWKKVTPNHYLGGMSPYTGHINKVEAASEYHNSWFQWVYMYHIYALCWYMYPNGSDTGPLIKRQYTYEHTSITPQNIVQSAHSHDGNACTAAVQLMPRSSYVAKILRQITLYHVVLANCTSIMIWFNEYIGGASTTHEESIAPSRDLWYHSPIFAQTKCPLQ